MPITVVATATYSAEEKSVEELFKLFQELIHVIYTNNYKLAMLFHSKLGNGYRNYLIVKINS